uniref:hypothetical protein n=1 Tax=Corynebacterium glutamicum TaxID=1718 RepID=UPI0015E87377|nr:hypothetical protein [Corynebacterium glutamicum]
MEASPLVDGLQSLYGDPDAFLLRTVDRFISVDPEKVFAFCKKLLGRPANFRFQIF